MKNNKKKRQSLSAPRSRKKQMVTSVLMAQSRQNSHWHKRVRDIVKSTWHFMQPVLSNIAVSFPLCLGEMHQHQYFPKAHFPKGNASRLWFRYKTLVFPSTWTYFSFVVSVCECRNVSFSSQRLPKLRASTNAKQCSMALAEWCTLHQYLTQKQTENCEFNSTV